MNVSYSYIQKSNNINWIRAILSFWDSNHKKVEKPYKSFWSHQCDIIRENWDLKKARANCPLSVLINNDQHYRMSSWTWRVFLLFLDGKPYFLFKLKGTKRTAISCRICIFYKSLSLFTEFCSFVKHHPALEYTTN